MAKTKKFKWASASKKRKRFESLYENDNFDKSDEAVISLSKTLAEVSMSRERSFKKGDKVEGEKIPMDSLKKFGTFSYM